MCRLCALASRCTCVRLPEPGEPIRDARISNRDCTAPGASSAGATTLSSARNTSPDTNGSCCGWYSDGTTGRLLMCSSSSLAASSAASTGARTIGAVAAATAAANAASSALTPPAAAAALPSSVPPLTVPAAAAGAATAAEAVGCHGPVRLCMSNKSLRSSRSFAPPLAKKAAGAVNVTLASCASPVTPAHATTAPVTAPPAT
jgi:hypothetical protein